MYVHRLNFCTKTHTPLELFVPCAKDMIPGHSDRHNGSVSGVVCISCKSIILQYFIFSHADSSTLVYLSPSPLVLNYTILIIFIKAYYTMFMDNFTHVTGLQSQSSWLSELGTYLHTHRPRVVRKHSHIHIHSSRTRLPISCQFYFALCLWGR